MPSRLRNSDEYELINRNDSDDIFDLDETDFQLNGASSSLYVNREQPSPRLKSFLSSVLPRRLGRSLKGGLHRKSQARTTRRPRRRICRPTRRTCFLFPVVVGIIVALVVGTSILRPSYTSPPAHYAALRRTIESSMEYGRGNSDGQKIFIAASLYDLGGDLLGGSWGQSVLQLIDILGNQNVFLSIYENNSGPDARIAQVKFEQSVQCKHSIVFDKDFTVDDAPSIELPDGTERVKRISYLAELRNKALLPLEDKSSIRYDKILFLNDVIFDPIEATQLLFSTNLDDNGHTSYRAACALDFINPFKFYDTYATRDAEGYSMGVPFFPWFSTAGNGISRKDVLSGKDAVRVKSCWGGMIAWDAKPFLSSKPLRFRASPDLYWDASECCLINADLMNEGNINEKGEYVGIYVNPFIRLGYSETTLRWLAFTRRFESLYTIPHNIVNHLAGMPRFNPRRTEVAGSTVEEKVWISDKGLKEGGSFQTHTRKATGDGFCGVRMLQIMKERPEEGERSWEIMSIPAG